MSKKPTKVHHARVVPLPKAAPKGGERQVIREDSWSNVITGLGTSMDKRLGARIEWDYHSPEFFEQLYAGGGIPARIVDLVPAHALRRWVDWVGLDRELLEKVEDRSQQLDMRGALQRAWTWGRAYGGGVLHIVTDTRDPSRPLRVGERVIGLRDLSRWDLRILTTDIEYDFGSPNYGMPRLYYLNVQMGAQYKGYPIHWTRMIRFDGQLVPRRTYIRNGYWHDSILNRLYNSIRNYETSNDSAASVLQDFNVDVYKLKNLANLIGAGHEDIVKKRIELLQYAKSTIRAMLVDADDEEYSNLTRSIEGVAELVRMQADRLVADTDIPHTLLLGESPEGSNSTGNSTSQQWRDFIGSEQENYLRPKLHRLIEVVFPDLMPKLNFKFRPLRSMDDLETAELRNKQSITDKNYIDAGVLDPSEVADSRFGGDEYSLETELDKEGRAAGLIAPGMQAMGGLSGEEDPSGSPDAEEPQEPQGSPGGLPPAKPKQSSPAGGVEEKPTKDAVTQSLPTMNVVGQEGDLSGTQYAVRNEVLPPKPGKRMVPKDKPFVSMTMSEPMRNPAVPQIKGPGIPNQPRTFLPTRGNGVTAQSGYDFQEDAGSEGTATEAPLELQRQDSEPMRAATIVVKRDGQLLMGKRRDTGRWTLPGGVVERSESMHQGALRELSEETGIGTKRLHFLGARMVEPEQGKQVQVNMYQHKADAEVEPNASLDPDNEIEEFVWVPLAGPLPEEIANNLQHPNNVALAHLGLLK